MVEQLPHWREFFDHGSKAQYVNAGDGHVPFLRLLARVRQRVRQREQAVLALAGSVADAVVGRV